MYDRGANSPIVVLGIVASLLLVVGLIFPYVEIWRRRGRVIGIDWVLNLALICFAPH